MTHDPNQPEAIQADYPEGTDPTVAEGQGEADTVAPVEASLVDGEELESDAVDPHTPDPGEPPLSGEQVQVVEALQMEIEALKQQLAQQAQQFESHKAQAIRIAADFDNFRKRTQKEKEELEHIAKRNALAELLPVVDNFERARSQIKPETEGEMGIHKSYQGVYKNLVDGLKRLGVAAMRPEGQDFDPNYHEAMMREPTSEYPEGAVIEQLVRGYLLHDRVLRHAMVKVAAPPEPETPVENQEETPESPEV
ncbi:MAG: nucleotide exchange factor GrpE [Spirulina sp. DLM2.Bin59]|nr:MAG: nucleotide exchange factor GrpE [Spirulina sp. DLM2.Bin59]